MAEPWYTKNIKAKATEIANLKKVVKSKSVTISQQTIKLKTLAKQIKNLQKDLKEFTTTISTQRETITDMGVDILTLKNKLQDSQRGSQRREKQVSSLKTVWLFIKDFFKV